MTLEQIVKQSQGEQYVYPDVLDVYKRQEYDKAEADLIQYLRTYKNADDEKVAKALRGEVMVKMGILKAISALSLIHI